MSDYQIKRVEAIMEPGKEFDALIAEKVMGCKVGDYRGHKICDCSEFENRAYHHTKQHSDFPRDQLATRPIKNYSTDISAAWEVVEKLSGHPLKEKKVLLTVAPSLDGTYQCMPFKIYNEAGYDIKYAVTTWGVVLATAPHAICLAALKAVGCEDA